MEPDFWLERWREARTGFHQDAPTPLLLKHWPAVGAEPGSRVFVPLAGKSLDMAWFASQGYRVLGAELSPLAVAQFFESQGVEPSVDEAADGIHHLAGPIELVQGDVFALDAMPSPAARRCSTAPRSSRSRRRCGNAMSARSTASCRLGAGGC